MKAFLNALLIISVILGLLILIGVIVILFKFNHVHWLSDFDTKLFGLIGDFIGGLVGTIFAIATTVLLYQTYLAQKEDVKESKKLTRLQIDLLVKPDLYFANAPVHGFSRHGKEGEYYAWTFSNNEGLDPSSPSDRVLIKLTNIGIGVAKNIRYNWDFDLAAIQSYICTKFPDGPLVADKDIALKNLIQIDLNGFDTQMAFGVTAYKIEQRIDVVMPTKTVGEGLEIWFPTVYLVYYFIALRLFLKSETDLGTYTTIDDFPKCTLFLKYRDIADTEYQKSFHFSLVGDTVIWSGSNEDYSRVLSYTIQANEMNVV